MNSSWELHTERLFNRVGGAGIRPLLRRSNVSCSLEVVFNNENKVVPRKKFAPVLTGGVFF